MSSNWVEQKKPSQSISVKSYQKIGKISHEVFSKTPEEKQRIKELKKNCNNSLFIKNYIKFHGIK